MPTPFHNGRPDHRINTRHTVTITDNRLKEPIEMSATTVKYVVNGVISTWWNRIIGSKTTWIVVAFVLAKVQPLFENDGWQHLSNWKTAAALAFGGAGFILVRSAIAKAELASNALNPAITGVKAIEVPRTSSKGAITTALLCALGLTAGLSFTGCVKDSPNTPGNNKPVMTGKICMGGYCFGPELTPPPPPPLPTPPPIAVAQQQPILPDILKTLEK